MNYNLNQIKDWIIFEAKMGSYAYGTSLPTSDIDIRGVFIQPLKDIIKYGYVEQVSDEKNDIIFYELKRFINLCEKNNPNILELLFAPKDCIIKTSEEWSMISEHASKFLTKSCRWTFGGYANEQIKKAKGYNKKINWEESEMKRKSVLDFCYILVEGGSILFKKWLKKYNENTIDNFTQKEFGLVNIDHAHNLYAMYNLASYDICSGIVSNEEIANDVQLVSIPKKLKVVGYLYFNKDAYSTHCKKYKEYQTWIKNRNESRFKMNKEHGKNYDSKNLMHTLRLLNTALEIADKGIINVKRSPEEIEKLMKIRHGVYDLDVLLKEADETMSLVDQKFKICNLPDNVDKEFTSNLLLNIRKKFYSNEQK